MTTFDEGGYTDLEGNIINPDDYDNETDYINAIPGMSEYLTLMDNAPDSEWEDVPREYFHEKPCTVSDFADL